MRLVSRAWEVLGSYSSTIELHPPGIPFYEGRRSGRKSVGEP